MELRYDFSDKGFIYVLIPKVEKFVLILKYSVIKNEKTLENFVDLQKKCY